MDDAIYKVLIVDDNPHDAELASMALRKGGFAFTYAVAGGEAELRAQLARFEPDIVLSDFAFPDFDGIGAAAIVAEMRPGTPVIFVSGTITEERAVIALRSGAVDYVLKSSLLRLPVAVAHAVREARAQRRLEQSLRTAEAAARRHAERLDALWGIANEPSLRGMERVQAMLVVSAAALRAPQRFHGQVVRIEGEELVVVAVSLDPDSTGAGPHYPPGTRIPISRTGAATVVRTEYWDETTASGLPPLARDLGFQSLIATRFAVGTDPYALTFGSEEPATFDSLDVAYCEVLADAFAAELKRGELEASLRHAEAGLVRHVDRLGALWRIANDSTLRGLERIQAMLNESAAAIRAGLPFRGILWRIESRELVCIALTPVGDGKDFSGRRYPPGARFPVAGSSAAGELRTQYWDEASTTAGMSAPARELGWRAEITTRFGAGAAEYYLVFGSREPTTFDPSDPAYVEVLAESFASELARGDLEATLRAADERLRRHAERLETLWRIANDPTLRGADRIETMLTESASAIRPAQRFRGIISRITGDRLLVLHLTPDADGAGNARYPVGTLLPLESTVAAHQTRTRSWNDIAAGSGVPPTARDLGWHSVITTRFEAAGSTYVLTYGSTVPTEFGPEDAAYVEVLAASFGNQFELDDSARRTRQHADRLEALWRIVNNPNLRDEDLWFAMLQESASAIRPGQAYHGRFVRIEGDMLVREAIVSPVGYVPSAAEAAADAADRFPLAGTVAEQLLAAGGGPHAWDDLRSGLGETHGARVRGWRGVIGTTFAAGGKTYALMFASTEPASEPFGPLERSFIEVLASFFARHVQERWQYDRIAYQQSHDVLTGLLNRSQFRSLARMAAAANPRFAIVLVDVDAFREINESYGHMIGDALLVEVGAALEKRATGDEIVGRIAGDVFGVYLPDPATPQAVIAAARRFAEAFAHGFSTGDREGREFVALTASLGLAFAPYDGRTIDEILSHADAALFAAKQRGNGSIVAYTAGMEGDPQRRATLRNDLIAAIAGDEFVLYFQPHVDVRDDTVTGCEALIRWQHPTRGLLPPGGFIPFAEQTGIITGIDEWVMRSAFSAANELSVLRPGFRLYFNLSGRQAGSPDVVHAFVRAARDGISIRNIGVEITESDAMRDVEATRRVCRALKRLGVRIAIDDFGTGYSSLSSLKRLPVDIIKIDQSFISGVVDDPQDEAIAETIIAIAERFGFASLAEGVERPEEIAWLQGRSCRLAQGFAYSKALPLGEFKSWLAAREAV